MEEFAIKQRPLVVLGKVFRDMNLYGFSFISKLDIDKEKIHEDQIVVVDSKSKGGTIIAKIKSRKKAKDNYFCWCDNMFYINENGTPVYQLLPPLAQSPVHMVKKINFACERV